MLLAPVVGLPVGRLAGCPRSRGEVFGEPCIGKHSTRVTRPIVEGLIVGCPARRQFNNLGGSIELMEAVICDPTKHVKLTQDFIEVPFELIFDFGFNFNFEIEIENQKLKLTRSKQ